MTRFSEMENGLFFWKYILRNNRKKDIIGMS